MFTSDLNAVISALDTKINLRAVVLAREGQPEVVSEVAPLPYIPGFSVQPAEVLLSNHMPVVKLRVTATKTVLENLQVWYCCPGAHVHLHQKRMQTYSMDRK